MATEAQIERKKNKLEKATAMMRGGVGEPVVRESNYKVDLMLALNWYNANEDSSKLTKFGIEYLKRNKLDDYIKYFNLASDFETNQMSILMRLISREQYVADEHSSLIMTRLKYIKDKYTEKLKEKELEKKVTVEAGSATSVLDRVTEVARKHAAEIDFELDKFFTNKSSDFSFKAYIAKNGLSAAVTKKIAESYKKLSVELKEAILGTDEQLIEAYSHLSTSQLKKFSSLVSSIIEDGETQVLVAKANRMPRKRKAKPAADQVARMQYLQEFAELNLKSIHPTKVVGAQQLWVYNTKTRKLGCYYAIDSGGFSVKGTSIQGWDPVVSYQNTLRKPGDTIKQVMDGNKSELKTIFGKLTTLPVKLNGRTNSDTILLRVL